MYKIGFTVARRPVECELHLQLYGGGSIQVPSVTPDDVSTVSTPTSTGAVDLPTVGTPLTVDSTVPPSVTSSIDSLDLPSLSGFYLPSLDLPSLSGLSISDVPIVTRVGDPVIIDAPVNQPIDSSLVLPSFTGVQPIAEAPHAVVPVLTADSSFATTEVVSCFGNVSNSIAMDPLAYELINHLM